MGLTTVSEEPILPAFDASATVPPAAGSGRLFLAMLGLGLLVLLGTARALQPSPAGMGTHQQLGLPPCTATVLWGIRCPACGMTTSWAYFTRGMFLHSMKTNAGGFLLAAMAVIVSPYLLYVAYRARALPNTFLSACAVSLVFIVVVTVIDWTMRLLP